ncbi:MAG: O-antigen ligase family protein [Clostridia bacterium]|nr:O-antigen ligase family protein [Clostridia bacterium]
MEKIKEMIKSEKFLDAITILPIIFFLCIVPMMMGYKEVELKGPVLNYWITDNVNDSFFSYVKMIAINICAVFSLLILLIRTLMKKVSYSLNIYIIFAVLYGIFIIISSYLSPYKFLPFNGAPDRYEGMFVLLSYVFMFIYTLLFIDSFKKVKIVMKCFIISICLMTFFGALEFFGFHLVEINFIRKLLHFPIDTAANLGAQQTTSLSLYSINYVGQYLSLVIPLILFSFYTFKKTIYKFLFVFISYFALMCIFGSYSYASFVAIVFSLLVFLILYRRTIIKQYLFTIVLVVCLIVFTFLTNIFLGGLIAKRAEVLSPAYEGNQSEFQSSSIYLNNILIDGNTAFIDTDLQDFYITYENDSFIIKDESSTVLPLLETADSERIFIDNEEYKDFSFNINNEEKYIRILFSINNFYLASYEDTLKVVGYKYHLLDVVPIEKTSFQFPETLFSNRGIIYNGLLPSIRDHLLFGNGADTTILSYPQNDVIGKINVFHTPIILISKPHSLYIQILHDLGLFALITFILMIGFYAVKSIRLYINCQMTEKNAMGIAIAVSLFAYLIASVCYDSTVHISPIFWTLLALGITVNRLKEE